jgi:hypothetical protein
MGALDSLMRRLGFAKLDRYGLVLTPDDRVISMRPAVLDDGLGSKIVGWLEGDLAAMELEHWGAPKPATAKPIAAPASLHRLPARIVAPAAPIAPSPQPSMSPVAFATTVMTGPAAFAPTAMPPSRPLPGVAPIAPAPIAPVAMPAPAPVVAAGEEPGEDEWEWEIAMARARAAAEEVEQARVDLLGASAVVASAVIQRKTHPGMAVPPPLPDPPSDWPGTEPFNETWNDRSEVAPQVMSVLQKKLAVQRSTPARGQQAVPPAPPHRATVIPVPQLPTAADPRMVRPPQHTPSQPPRGRVARGTGGGNKVEETVRTQAAPPPANDDYTAPYIELPAEVKPVGFARTKPSGREAGALGSMTRGRVAAKQR